MTAVSENQGLPEGPVAKSRKVRRSKIIRDEHSYRPGMPVPVDGARQLDLPIFIPAATAMGTDEEWTAVRAFAADLQRNGEPDQVVRVGNDAGAFVVVLRLRGSPVLTDDQLLSQAFMRLKTFIEGSVLLQNGFTDDKPRWEAIKGGDFVADEGTFN